ncbi:hypothetical protein HDU78_011244, partial [Chytriomyces hyalinus]
QRALNELNFYRELLQLAPLNSMDAFEFSTDNAIVEPTPCQGSIARAAAFETMPPEILDRIVQFVDDESILPLCHSMPYYKYISAAMFDFAHRFPDEDYGLYQLWPNMQLTAELNETDFPIQHLHAAAVYARIISKHDGRIHVPCSKNVLNYLGTFPDVLYVHPGDTSSSSGWAEFLRGLADAKKRIQSCTVDVNSVKGNWTEVATQLTRLQIKSLSWEDSLPVEIQEVLPFISGLSSLEITFRTNIQENILSRCLTLREIVFTRLNRVEDTVYQLGRILQYIKGSCIQKVWCDIPFWWSEGCEALETISSEFLRHGWHKETHEDDDYRACFVYRHV